MSFSGSDSGRPSSNRSSVSQDGFREGLPMLATPARANQDVKQTRRAPSRLSNVASQRQRSLQRKPPEPLRRAVADCLSASHHGASSSLTSEAVRTLQDYLASSSTVDIAYTVLLEHALAERDRSPPVVAKCVALLKRYLFRYIPTKETLEQIDTFCVNLICECTSITNKQNPSWLQSPKSRQGTNLSVHSSSSTSTSAAFASESLVKSLNYVRALVAKHIPKHSFQPAAFASNAVTPSKQFYPSLTSLRTRSFGPPVNSSGVSSRISTELSEAAKSSFISMLGLEPIDEENINYISLDVLKLRWIGSRQHHGWTPSPVMTDSGGIARPQIEKKFEYLEMGVATLLMKGIEQKSLLETNLDKSLSLELYSEQLLLPSTVTTVTDTAAAQSHLRAIAASKRVKAGSSNVWEDVPVSTWRYRPRPLFQYRYYSEQQPLKLSSLEVDEVIAAVCTVGPVTNTTTMFPRYSMLTNQTGRVSGVDASDIAASVLIKLVIDMYMENSDIAAPLAFSMLEGMLISPQLTARTRAFDLILNLGIHAHLLETMRRENQSIPSEDLSGRPVHNNVKFPTQSTASPRRPEKSENGTPHAVTEFEIWLLKILYELLLLLVQIEEKEESVWASALSCLMYMVSDRGRILRSRLKELDIRVAKAFLEVSRENSWAEELHCRLIRLLTNMLYCPLDSERISNSDLDVQQLEVIGGIEFICEEYARANMAEEKNNLFGLLFDYTLYEMKNKCFTSGNCFPSSEEIQAIATVLVLAGAPEAFSVAVKIGLNATGNELKKSILKSISRDVTSGRLNSVALKDILDMLDSIIGTHSRLAEEFSDMFNLTLASQCASDRHDLSPDLEDSDKVSQAWNTLNALLHSPRAVYRQNGYRWLVELLLSEIMSDKNMLNIQNIQQQFGMLGFSERSNSELIEDTGSNCSSSALDLLTGLLKSKYNYVRCGFIIVLERLLLWCQLPQLADHDDSDETLDNNYGQDGSNNTYSVERANAVIELMNGALSQIFSANETDRINILKTCDLLFSQLCIRISPSMQALMYRNTVIRDALSFYSSGSNLAASESRDRHGAEEGSSKTIMFRNSGLPSRSTSKAALLLRGYAAAPRQLIASVPTNLLYWPLIQLAGAATDDMSLGIAVGSKGRGNIPGGASDIRAALLLLLIGKCSVDHAAFQEVGGEEFFRSLLDDTDARVAYYTSAFLLKRMMSEEPETYQRMLYNLVSKAQQSNNEKLLENPYLQMRGILHLSSDLGSHLLFNES